MDRIDTDAYRASHTRAPRGYGYWGFGPGTSRAPVAFDGSPETAAVWFTGTYTDARAQLAALVKAEPAASRTWHVLP